MDISEFWFLLWEWIKQTIGGLFQQAKNIFTLTCPADAIIEDNYGRKIGILNNQQINEIPSAKIISADSIEIYELPNDLQYFATITGLEQGKADIDLLLTSNVQTNKIRSIIFNKIPLNYNSKAQFDFSCLQTDDSIRIDLNNDGNFEQSMVATIDTSFSLDKPNAPSSLVATIKSDNNVQLDWVDNSDNEYAFVLERKTGNEMSFRILANLSPNTLQFLDETEKADSVYYYRIKAITPASESEYSNEAMINLKTEVKQHITHLPSVFELSQNYPSPFNSITKIQFSLPKTANVKIEAYNVYGQRVAVLLDARKPAGYHTVEFDGKDFASGLYFYRMTSERYVEMKKMLVIN